MDLIKAQYPEEVARFNLGNISAPQKVLDVWHREGNEVWVGGAKIIEQSHDFRYTPVCIEVVTLGSMLSDPDTIARRGESIFFLIRDIIPQLNRLASIVATQAQVRVKPPIQTPNPGGRTAEPPDYEEVMDMGSSSSADPDMLTKVLDTGGVNRAAEILFSMISTALDEGGFSSQDLGVLGTPPASGVALLEAKERRDKTLNPRLRVKSNLKRKMGDMFTKQVELIGGTVELDNRDFIVSKIAGQYQVRHKFTVMSKAIDAGMASLMAAYGAILSDEDKREMLEREDPKGDIDRLNWQMVGMKYPIVQMRRDVESLLRYDKDGSGDEEAKLIIDSAGVELDKLLAGELEEKKPEDRQEPKQVVSLFGGQSGGGKPPEEI